MYDPEQYSIVKRFTQELDCTFAHGNNSHLGITMRSDEDDWCSGSLGLKLCLQFKPGHARHTNIGDEARSVASGFGIQELFCRAEAKRGQAVGLDQISQRMLN